MKEIPRACKKVPAQRLCAIHWHHRRVNILRAKMGKSPIKYQWLAEKHPALTEKLLHYWTKQHRHTKLQWRKWKNSNCTPSDRCSIVTIERVFGIYADQAIAVSKCESGLSIYAQNGQYLGLFQMGDYARSRYGFAYNTLQQVTGAYQYFVDSGKDWSPWECKP